MTLISVVVVGWFMLWCLTKDRAERERARILGHLESIQSALAMHHMTTILADEKPE